MPRNANVVESFGSGQKAQTKVDDVLYDVNVLAYIKGTNEYMCSSVWLEQPENVYIEDITKVKTRRTRPKDIQYLDLILKRTRAFKRKMSRVEKLYQCQFCLVKGKPGGRSNMMTHINGVLRKNKKGEYRFVQPCLKRKEVHPSVNGVTEQFQPLDITNSETAALLPFENEPAQSDDQSVDSEESEQSI